ncbi:MAG: ABC transporter permease [Acidimicrobiia bacterium]|nr:ABC transporter permease [Acidimicrobiia bacterium]MDH4307635.1 ABC transporter permease [Acidimicrobiia bacterium]MDH5294792.1 ABC transporter permease [Acidimicrobiia bacterium]MDH5522046.1 ABC transporter permease [Acidimicrobiia bacterium]
MTQETASPPLDERVRKVSLATRLGTRPEFGALVALIVVWVFFAIVANDNNFVSWATTAAILNRAAPLGILAVAVALLMISGEFDLSVGSVVGFAGMAIMLLVTSSSQGGYAWPLLPALLLAVVITLGVGFLNGLMVVTTKLPSFIITLGALFVFRGLATAIPRTLTNRTQLGAFDSIPGFDGLNAVLGQKVELFGARFDIGILWWLVITALATWVLTRTRIGNWIFGVGGDDNASRNVGVPVNKLKISLFMTTAFAAFLVALMQVTQFKSADSLRGELQEFNAIIAAVVGGVLLTGGYGSVIGAALGALIFAMVQQGIIITGVDGDWFKVFVGAILVVAVIFNNFVRQQAQKR